MSTSTTSDSKPICTALHLDKETVEALQSCSHLAEDDDYCDAHDLSSSSYSSTSTLEINITSSSSSKSWNPKSTATTVKILNFLTGLCTGAMFSCAGFVFLLQHWHNMGPPDVMLFALVWSVATSIVAYLLFNLLYTGTSCHFGKQSRKTISILENNYGVGIFLGFSGVCTSTDVVQGMATSITILTVVMAALWVCLMIYCALATRAANPAEKSQSKVLASRMRTSKPPPKKVGRSPQTAAPSPVVPEAPVIIAVRVTESPSHPRLTRRNTLHHDASASIPISDTSNDPISACSGGETASPCWSQCGC
jgi:hypothetical protein